MLSRVLCRGGNPGISPLIKFPPLDFCHLLLCECGENESPIHNPPPWQIFLYKSHLCILPTLLSLLDYDALFQHLEGVKGSVEVRRIFVQDVIREATKFKKKPLILQLEEWTEKLPSFRTGPGGKPKVKAEKR